MSKEIFKVDFHGVRRSIPRPLLRVLSRLIQERGRPERIWVNNGTELTSKVMDQWASWSKVKLGFSKPRKPTDNAFIESFNGKLREECLSQNWFLS